MTNAATSAWPAGENDIDTLEKSGVPNAGAQPVGAGFEEEEDDIPRPNLNSRVIVFIILTGLVLICVRC